MHSIATLKFGALCLSILVSGCALEIGNFEADENAKFQRDPDLAEYLRLRACPQDGYWHFSADAKRLHDRTTAEPIGFSFSVSVKRGLPFHELPFVKRALRIDGGDTADTNADSSHAGNAPGSGRGNEKDASK